MVPIAEDETGGSLFDKLSQAGAKLCVKVLQDLEDGKAVREKQPEESTTPYARMIDKKMGSIDWEKPAKEIEQLIRGLNPWPSAYTRLQGKTLKNLEGRGAFGAFPGSAGTDYRGDKRQYCGSDRTGKIQKFWNSS